jgi:uncharacterized membrane protein (UPF0127 family)
MGRQTFFFVILGCLIGLFYFGYRRFFIPQQKYVKVGSVTLAIEIADTDAKRGKGLSLHKPLEDREGMLFLFDKKDTYGFWMKQMLFPLDFIWIDGATVVDLSENIPAPTSIDSSDLPIYKPKVPVDKVLEVNAGFISKNGIKLGDTVTY